MNLHKNEAQKIDINRRADLREFVLSQYQVNNTEELRKVCPDAEKLNLSLKSSWRYLYDLIQFGKSEIVAKHRKIKLPIKVEMTIAEYRNIVKQQTGLIKVADLKQKFNTPHADARCKSVWVNWYKSIQKNADLAEAA